MKKDTVKRYDFSRKPRKPSKFWMALTRQFAIKPRLKGYKVDVRKINMEGIKPPYLLLATHASMLDFPLMYRAVAPYNANNVVAIDAVRDVGDFIMRRLGCICKRKFIRDVQLVKNMLYCLREYRSIVCVYPEARYSFDGTTSYLPESLAKFCKLAKVPVVLLRMYGTFVAAPQWNKDEQKIPLAAELECIATAEEVRELTVEELNGRIRRGLWRDDYAYQRENGIELKSPHRANGLHGILYQCPHCKTEFKMYSEGTRLWCSACGKSYVMSELSELSAEEGETEFTHIPDWVKWERENVRREVRSGLYRFDSEVTVHTLPNAKRFYDQGKGRLVQTAEGITLTCREDGEEVTLKWTAAELEGIHVEYDYPYRKDKYKKNIFGDCVDLSTNNNSYWLHPVDLRDQLLKLSFATEEIHALALERIRAAEEENGSNKNDT